MKPNIWSKLFWQIGLLARMCDERPPKSRDGTTGEGGACGPTILQLRHQRNKRPREPHSSFASSIRDYNAGRLVWRSKLHSFGEIDISQNLIVIVLFFVSLPLTTDPA